MIVQFETASHEARNLNIHHDGTEVVLHGYLGTRRVNVSKTKSFRSFLNKDLNYDIQLLSLTTANPDAHSSLQSLRSHTPVIIKGIVKPKRLPEDQTGLDPLLRNEEVEIHVLGVQALNDFAHDIEFQQNTNLPQTQRHLQMRQKPELRDALRQRSLITTTTRNFLTNVHDFLEIETPLLFRSTPEGAREFLVPTRAKGQAYALPQSPQQYKQVLMGSGIVKYFQIAKCFRDEDSRAERQPEFTQIDLEMSFVGAEQIMSLIEDLMKHLWNKILGCKLSEEAFPRLAYEDAMSRYGSDKPDVRLGMEILRVGHVLPAELIGKIGPLTNPIVDALKLGFEGTPEEMRQFVSEFMDSADGKESVKNPDGQPGIFLFDPRKPLNGLFPFGFEGAEQMEQLLKLEAGDVVIIQARNNEAFSGGSTSLGNLRLALHRFAVRKGLIEAPKDWKFLWVHRFPLFSPSSDSEPGQGGTAGLSSTHHPFTAPADISDIDVLLTDPRQSKGDHYDLVLNGVELGGGSRRIHDASMQEFIFREVLEMGDKRVEDFRPLLDVLRAGCPPHAGIALGLDRLCAVMLGKDTIRDVIAFPKTGRGEDVLMKSPSQMTSKQLETYHLRLTEN